MSTKTALELTDIHVSKMKPGNEKTSLGCNFNGARYHIWVGVFQNRVAWTGDALYKNPPLEVRYKAEGYFHTRHLKADSQFGRKLISQMFDYAEEHGLFAKKEAELQAEEDAKQMEQARLNRIATLQEFGVEMYDVLCGIRNGCNLGTVQMSESLHDRLERMLEIVDKSLKTDEMEADSLYRKLAPTF